MKIAARSITNWWEFTPLFIGWTIYVRIDRCCLGLLVDRRRVLGLYGGDASRKQACGLLDCGVDYTVSKSNWTVGAKYHQLVGIPLVLLRMGHVHSTCIVLHHTVIGTSARGYWWAYVSLTKRWRLCSECTQ